MMLMRLRRLIYTRITTKITQLPQSDFDCNKRPTGNSRASTRSMGMILSGESPVCLVSVLSVRSHHTR
jgi:hypothetical protein